MLGGRAYLARGRTERRRIAGREDEHKGQDRSGKRGKPGGR